MDRWVLNAVQHESALTSGWLYGGKKAAPGFSAMTCVQQQSQRAKIPVGQGIVIDDIERWSIERLHADLVLRCLAVSHDRLARNHL